MTASLDLVGSALDVRQAAETRELPLAGSVNSLLPEGGAIVSLALPDQITNSELLVEYEEMLDAEERDAYHRIRFQSDRHLYLVSHALLRTTLSRFGDRGPSEWRFTRNQYPIRRSYERQPE